MDVEAGEEVRGDLGTDAIEVLDYFLRGRGLEDRMSSREKGLVTYRDKAGFREVEAQDEDLCWVSARSYEGCVRIKIPLWFLPRSLLKVLFQ